MNERNVLYNRTHVQDIVLLHFFDEEESLGVTVVKTEHNESFLQTEINDIIEEYNSEGYIWCVDDLIEELRRLGFIEIVKGQKRYYMKV